MKKEALNSAYFQFVLLHLCEQKALPQAKSGLNGGNDERFALS